MELQWPLILFTTFIAWSAGLFATQAVYSLRGEGAKAQMTALIASVVLMAVGGIAVFFHLQHWERIFNGFGHLTSGITQELIAIVVLAVFMVVYFVYLRRSGEEAKIPQWLAIASIVMAAVLVCVMGHSYMMSSRPAWDSVLQIGSLVGAACGFGPATMALICELRECPAGELDGLANFYGQIANAVLTVLYLIAMTLAAGSFTQVSYWFDPTSPTQEIIDTASLSPFTGDALIPTLIAILFVAGGVACGYMGKKKGGNWKLWGGAGAGCVFVAALCLRAVLYIMGISVYSFF